MFQKLTLISQRNNQAKNASTVRKGKKLIFSFAFFLLFIFVFCIISPSKTSCAVVKPTSGFYVNDYANILSTETEQYIMNSNVELQQKTGAQIVVVTIKSLDGMSIEEYANQLFNNFGIGDKEKNNGLLILCSYGDRQLRIEVGDGLEGRLPDGKTGRIQDEYMIPYLKKNDFDTGIKNGFSVFLREVANEYGVTMSNNELIILEGNTVGANTTYDETEENSTSDIIESIIYVVLIIGFYVLFFFIGGRGRGGPFIFFGGGGYHGGGGHGGFHGGGFSGGGFHGGGGHSSGGGSTRGF